MNIAEWVEAVLPRETKSMPPHETAPWDGIPAPVGLDPIAKIRTIAYCFGN